MVNEVSPNYNFEYPDVGLDEDTWGNILNENWRLADLALAGLQTAVNTKQDAANLVSTVIDLVYPVGSIYLSLNAVNPGTFLTGTTWERVSEGRALVGVGTADGEAWVAGEQKGKAKHALVSGELPTHSHVIPQLGGTTDEVTIAGEFVNLLTTPTTFGERGPSASGAFSFDLTFSPEFPEGDPDFDSRNKFGEDEDVKLRLYTLTFKDAHEHTVTIAPGVTNNAGGGTSHNNIQPSLAVYIWSRVA